MVKLNCLTRTRLVPVYVALLHFSIVCKRIVQMCIFKLQGIYGGMVK